MKLQHKHLTSLLFTVITLLTLCSCDPDWWQSRTDIEGSWRIVETSGYTNYQRNDNWYFYRNGNFSSYGYDLDEFGYWSTRGRHIQISFDDYGVDIDAYVREYDGEYMVLDVQDYSSYNTNYTLRLVREAYY